MYIYYHIYIGIFILEFCKFVRIVLCVYVGSESVCISVLIKSGISKHKL